MQLIDLTLGQAVFPTTEPMREAAARATAGDLPAHYPDRRGLRRFRVVLAQRHSSASRPVRPEHITVTCGATQAIVVLLAGLCRAGDRVAVPDPGFPHYWRICRLLGLVPVGYPQPRAGEPFPARELGATLDRHRSAVVLWNSPANPTGWVATDGDLRSVADLLGDRPVHVVSDEVYEEMVFAGRHRSLADLMPPAAVSSVHSCSKSLSLAGWRLGYAISDESVAAGCADAVWTLSMGASTVAQLTAMVGFVDSANWAAQRRTELQDRCAVLNTALETLGCTTREPHGGCFLWLDARTPQRAGELVIRLRDELRVQVMPGRAFGERGESHLRVSFGAAMTDVAEAAHRLMAATSDRESE